MFWIVPSVMKIGVINHCMWKLDRRKEMSLLTLINSKWDDDCNWNWSFKSKWQVKRASLRHLEVMITPNKINSRNITNYTKFYHIISMSSFFFRAPLPFANRITFCVVLFCLLFHLLIVFVFFCLLFEKHWKKCDLVKNLSHARKPVKCDNMGNKEYTYICLVVNM